MLASFLYAICHICQISTYSPVRHLSFLAVHGSLETFRAPSLAVVPHPHTFPGTWRCAGECQCHRWHAHFRTGWLLQLKAGGGVCKVTLAQGWGIVYPQAVIPVFLALTGHKISLSVSPMSNCHNKPWTCVVHILPQT